MAGRTSAAVGNGAAQAVDWSATPDGATLTLPATGPPVLHLAHSGTGAPWVSVLQSAVAEAKAPANHGFAIRKTITPLAPRAGGVLARGDVVTVHLDVEAVGDAAWVALDDPLPAGATLVGDAFPHQSGGVQPAWTDPRFDRLQAFFAQVPAGHFSLDYTLRLDTAGRLNLPATRVEAMYAPEMFGERPNAAIEVAPR